MADIVHVRFATNRNPVGRLDIFGNGFRDNNPNRYVTGSVDMLRLSDRPDTGWEPDRNTLQIDLPPIDAKRLAVAPATARNDLVSFARDRTAANLLLHANARGSDYGLILIPGFAHTFIDALRRTAQVARAYHAAEIFVFSWPANGIVDRKNYFEDQGDARKSASVIAHSMLHLLKFLGEVPVASRPVLNIVAHSMGNYALRYAIQAIVKYGSGIIKPDIFQGALLMAADEDHDSLSQPGQLGPLVKMAKRITVYKAGGDLALALSQALNGWSPLGMWGPKRLASLPKKVTSIDCSDVAATQGDNGESHYSHQYYRLSPQVIKDVVQVLGDKAPDDIDGRYPDLINPVGGRAWWISYGSTTASKSKKPRRAARRASKKRG